MFAEAVGWVLSTCKSESVGRENVLVVCARSERAAEGREFVLKGVGRLRRCMIECSRRNKDHLVRPSAGA